MSTTLPAAIADQHPHGGRVVAIWAYVTQQGWRDEDREDLVQIMLCEWWSRREQPFHYALAYLHALDRMDPRQGVRFGRERHSTQLPRQTPPEPRYIVNFDSAVYVEELLAQCGEHVEWLRKIIYEDWSLADVARSQGVTQAALTSRLTKLRRRLHCT